MAVTAVSICNIAVGWLGGNEVTDITTPTIEEEILCKDNYEVARDKTLEARNWTFAMAREELTAEVSTPDFGFSKEFALPTGCLRLVQVDSDTTMIYGETWVREQDLILADVATLYVRYVKQITDPTKFSAHFVHALACRLAADLAIPLTGSKDLMKLYEGKYDMVINEGGALDGLQGKNQELRSNTLINVR